jgi:hypothetical protein
MLAAAGCRATVAAMYVSRCCVLSADDRPIDDDDDRNTAARVEC